MAYCLFSYSQWLLRHRRKRLNFTAVKFHSYSTVPGGNCNPHLENGHLQMEHLQRGILKHPIFNVLNFRGWIKLIYDKITLIYCVQNEFNPTSEVQNIENGVFQNAPFANAPFANGRFPNGDYSSLWAKYYITYAQCFEAIYYAQRQL